MAFIKLGRTNFILHCPVIGMSLLSLNVDAVAPNTNEGDLADSSAGELLYVDLKINGQITEGIYSIVVQDDLLWIASEQIDDLHLPNTILLKKAMLFGHSFTLLPKSISFAIDRESLELRLDIPQSDLPSITITQSGGHLDVSPKTYAGYWNYHLSLFHDPLMKTAAFETANKPVVATPYGSLINQFLTTVGPTNSIVRLETAYEIDFAKSDLRFTAGDSATDSPSWGNHVPMAGFKLQKDFLFQTGLLSYPTISLSGFAPRNGEAEIWLNDALRQSKEIPRGGFLLDNLNLPSGSQSGTLVVRDSSGIVSKTPFSYYADPQLLRPHTQAYSYSLGFIREHYGQKSFSYGEPMLFGNHKIGVTKFWSPGLHTEVTSRILMIGTEQRFGLWSFGSTAFGCAYSLSKNGSGYLVADELNLNFFRVLTSTHAQLASAHFTPVGVKEALTKFPAYTLSGTLRLDLPYVNQTAVSYIFMHREKPRLNAIGLKQSLPFFDSLAMSASGEFDFLTNNVVVFCFVGARLPFDHHMSSQANKNGDQYGGAATLSKNPDPQKSVRYAYNATGGYEKFAYGQGDVCVDTKYLINRWSAFGAQGKFNYMGELNGAFGGIRDQLFFSRPIDGGILLVEMPEQKNVGVFKDNSIYLGKTNDRGRLVVTNLKPFETAHLSFDAKDMDIATKASSSSQEIEVTPGFQSAHRVALQAPVVRNIQFRLLRDGEILSPGTRIDMNGLDKTFIMNNGAVFVEVPKDSAQIDGVDELGHCKFKVNLPATADKLIEELGDVHCN